MISECPTCHAYLTQNCLALSLPIPVLEYIRDYVLNTPKASRKPLREVRRVVAIRFSCYPEASTIRSFSFWWKLHKG